MVVRLLKQYILLLGVLLFNSFLTSCFEEEEEDVPTVDDEVLHKFVDLGLPSGLKWGNCNLGAKTAEESGDFYAWGEIKTKKKFYHDSKFYFVSPQDLRSQGVVDQKDNLINAYDAAMANLGGSWRVPTKADFDELIKYCNWTWTSLNGVKGYKVVSKKAGNKNWIFLPITGTYDCEIIMI